MSPTSTSVDASKPSKYYRCQKIVAATGKPCTGTFKYPQHLRRHDKHFHLNVSTTFIHVTPGSQSRRSVFTNPKLITPRRRLSTRQIAPESTSVRARSSRSLQSVVANPHKAACSPTALPHASQPASVSPVQSHTALQWPLPAETASTASSCMSPTFATPQFALPPPLESTHPQGSDDDTLAFDDAAWAYKDHATLARNQHPSTSDPGPRPRTLDQAPKPSDAHIPPKSATPLPTYEAKSSPQTHAQPKALAWLTQAAKAKFDSTYEALLAGWGVTTRHTGTCVLVPEDWRFSNPLDLMASFGLDNVPAVGSSRAWYSCADHGTTLARAKVWFSKPRTGLDLDVFVGCGPYKPMDASHLCHHEHCIVHLIYEPANINHARQECCRRARFLRGERRPVPEHCTIHEPPCMMQRAAVTSLEAYRHQFQVLCEAYGLPVPEPAPRPRRYLFSTIESALPCQFSSIEINKAELVSAIPSNSHESRPGLTCKFCSPTRLKAFASIAGLWGHIINKHQEVPNDCRLEEILHSASLWRTYWKLHSYGGKRHHATLAKLDQIQHQGFCWRDVMAWSLR